jgi:penicillin-binding protein 1C
VDAGRTTPTRSGRLSRAGCLRQASVVLAGGCAILIAALAWLVGREVVHLGPPPLAAAAETSVTVLDRHGDLLRAFTTSQGRWRLPTHHAEVDKRYLELLFAFEDGRFYAHGGVDVLALARAVVQVVTNGRIISGGSTLTMQVARLLEGRHDRTARGKLRQIIRALQIERRLSKAQILDLYLRLAPFGGNIEGVRAASLTYFSKEPRRLSLGEAALLVALPQSPESRRPDRHPAAARRARSRVLQRAVAAGIISSAEARRARAEPVPTARHAFPMLAAHLTSDQVASHPQRKLHRLTIDGKLQRELERLAARHAAAIGKRISTAVMIVENETGAVRVRIGSPGYFADERFGAVDMSSALRSPGSALKPVIYGLAFEMGLAHPATLIDDRPVRFGTYAPKNFDEGYRGTITVREALAKSLNIPAVKLLDAVGPGRFLGRLRRSGIPVELPDDATPSLAVALGGLGIRLEDMARLYTALARGGLPIGLSHRLEENAGPAQRPAGTIAVLDEVATHYVTDILKDAPPPEHAKKGEIAYKTGTSYGYRDAWAAGYDGRHTVVVWVGRPDAASTPGLTGRTAAAPLLFDAFQHISRRRSRLPTAPRAALAGAGANLPEPLRRFERNRTLAQGGAFLVQPPRIAFPPDRAEVAVEGQAAPLVLKASGGELPMTWLADGRPIALRQRNRQIVWQNAPPGFVRLTVVDARGRTDQVTVRLRTDAD